MGSFLRPPGFTQPALAAVLRELHVVAEARRYAASSRADRAASKHHRIRALPAGSNVPVVLVPGFLAGDGTLRMMSNWLRAQGFRTYRSHIRANINCTQDAVAALEQRVEEIVLRRGERVFLVGHSLGGMMSRGLAARRPDLVAGIVTMGSPVLAPGAHHKSLTTALGVLLRLSHFGIPGLMSSDCVAGECAEASFREVQEPLAPGVGFTAIYSKRDGIVDWRACVGDPDAERVEVHTSHVGMAVDPGVMRRVAVALRSMWEQQSLAEVDSGVGA